MAANKAAAAAAAVMEEWICEDNDDDDVSDDDDLDFDGVSFSSVGNREMLEGRLLLHTFCTRVEWPDRDARKA